MNEGIPSRARAGIREPAKSGKASGDKHWLAAFPALGSKGEPFPGPDWAAALQGAAGQEPGLRSCGRRQRTTASSNPQPRGERELTSPAATSGQNWPESREGAQVTWPGGAGHPREGMDEQRP